MAQASLVDFQYQDGLRLIDRLSQQGVPIAAAFWVEESDADRWFLYLATPLIGEDGAKKSAYHRVNKIVRQLQTEEFGIEPLQIKLIGAHDPICRDVLALRGSHLQAPTWVRSRCLGELPVAEAIIYPPMNNASQSS